MTALVRVPPFPSPLQVLTVQPTRIADLATELLVASARLDDTAELARTDGRVDAWRGAAAEAYRRQLAVWALRTEAMSLALRHVGRRIEGHAETMRDLRSEADLLAVANRALAAEVVALAEEVRDLGARAARATPGAQGAVLLEATALRARAGATEHRVRALDAQQVDWWARVVAEEETVVDLLARTIELEQVEARWGGGLDPADAALAARPSSGADPSLVRVWWEGLSDAQRRAVLVAAPGAVGGLDGVRARDRDAANRLRLRRDLMTLRHLDRLGVIRRIERRVLSNVEAIEQALEDHAGRVGVGGAVVPVLLWLYDPGAHPKADGDVDGRVAIAVGDPDTADAIALNVPGIDTETVDIAMHVNRAWELHQAAATATATQDQDQEHASIAWLGYDAPDGIDGALDVATAAAAEPARRGGALLAGAIDGLVALRGDDADVVPVGHSYGAVVVGSTLSGHEVDVDRAAVVGSPGLGEGIDDVGDLDLPRGGLHVGQNHDDPVAGLGQNGALGLGGVGHGQDPADDGFGGARFQANAAAGDDDHSSYYANDSESLHNLGLVLAGLDPTPAGPVHDPWWGPAVDPEAGAPSDAVDTDGDGDTDGVPRA